MDFAVQQIFSSLLRYCDVGNLPHAT